MPTSPLTPQSKPTLAVAIVANKAADRLKKKGNRPSQRSLGQRMG